MVTKQSKLFNYEKECRLYLGFTRGAGRRGTSGACEAELGGARGRWWYPHYQIHRPSTGSRLQRMDQCLRGVYIFLLQIAKSKKFS
jgi:hypothetical protein